MSRNWLGEPLIRATAGLFWLIVLSLTAGLALAHETGIRQPAAYLDPLERPLRLWAGVGAIAGLLMGFALVWCWRERSTRPDRLLVACATGASLVSTGSGAAWFLALPSPWFPWVAVFVPTLGSTLAMAGITLTWVALARYAQQLETLEYALSPFRLLAALLLLGAGAAWSAHVGLVRSGALVGMLWATLALSLPGLVGHLRAVRTGKNWMGWLGLPVAGGGALLLALGVFVWAEARIPRRALGIHNGDVIFTASTAYSNYLINSVQDSFTLFRNNELELSTTDDYRYHEALVHPAMSGSASRRRVLLLGGGKGIAEREILRWNDVQELLVVTEDRGLAELAQQMGWWRERAQNAWADPRISWAEDEPAPWLREHPGHWDVILVDLPDPTDYAASKNYTRYFYSLLAERLVPGGTIALQATSPFRSPMTFHSILHTVESAGLVARPYRSPIPTLGDWGFILATQAIPGVPPTRARSALPPGLRFLNPDTLRAMFTRPADVRSHVPTKPNLLHDQSLVDLFEGELPQE